MILLPCVDSVIILGRLGWAQKMSGTIELHVSTSVSFSKAFHGSVYF
jgi:hypothetical protein